MFGLITIKTYRERMQKLVQEMNRLRKELDHWKDEAEIWKGMYERELRKTEPPLP